MRQPRARPLVCSLSCSSCPTVSDALWTTSLISLCRLTCVAEISATNIQYHLGPAAWLQEPGLPGWLLHSGLTKASDSVDRGWLARCMTAMGLSPGGAGSLSN